MNDQPTQETVAEGMMPKSTPGGILRSTGNLAGAQTGKVPGLIDLTQQTIELLTELNEAIQSLEHTLDPIMSREPQNTEAKGQGVDRDMSRPDVRLRLINSVLRDKISQVNTIHRQVNI